MSGGKGTAAPQPPAYRLVAADELGVLRVIEVPAGPKWGEAAAAAKWGDANKEHAVHSLACSATRLASGAPAVLAVGRKGRQVELLDAHTGTQQASLTLPGPAATAAAAPPAAATAGSSKVAVMALAFVPAAAARPLQLVAGMSDGVVCICSCSSGGDDDAAAGQPGSTSWSVTHSFAVGPSLTCLDVDAAGSHIVVGGEGIQPSIWDISSGTRVWQGKGGKPNRIRLVDKPFTTAVAFLPCDDSSSGGCGGGGEGAAEEATTPPGSDGGGDGAAIARRFVAGSVTAKLHLYDTTAGRRPQREVVFGEARITALAPEASGTRVWAANGTGHMQLLLVGTFKLQDALKGAGGSVRALALHPDPSEGLLASVGLDRFVRVHGTSSRASRARVYLKQQLSAAAWLPLPPTTGAASVAAAAGGDAEAAGAAAVADAGAAAAVPQHKRSSKVTKVRRKADAGLEAADTPAAKRQHRKAQA